MYAFVQPPQPYCVRTKWMVPYKLKYISKICTFKKIVKKLFRIIAIHTPSLATIMEKINGQTAKIGVVLDTTSNVQPI